MIRAPFNIRSALYSVCAILAITLAILFYDSWLHPFDKAALFAVICFIALFVIVQLFFRKWYILAGLVLALFVTALSVLPLHSVVRVLMIQNDSRANIVLQIHDVNNRYHKRKQLAVGETWKFIYYCGDPAESVLHEMLDVVIRAIRPSDGAEYSMGMQLPIKYTCSEILKILDDQRQPGVHLQIQELNAGR
jgi:hypothetical protein